MELSPLSDGDLLTHVIAEALPLADQSTRGMLEVLVEYLAGRQLLLVLDTCEHLVEVCGTTIGTLLEAAPGLKVLATSRRPLGLGAEEVFTVEPLPVPEVDDPDAREADAVTLLVERAAAVVPGFAVTEDNHADLVRLSRALEGCRWRSSWPRPGCGS
ncbi:hypothetical protein NKH77_00405 [Streptomyces sp. M19]